jgi:uncharacterized protein (TIGR03437 family)
LLREQPCLRSNVFISAGAVLVVNFPSINYSYNVSSWLFTNLMDSSPYGPYAKPARSAAGSAAAASTCTAYLLQGVFTSIPVNFQTKVGQATPVEVELADDCGNALNSGSVIATFSSGDPSFPLTFQGAGRWTGTWTPRTAGSNVTITLMGASSSGTSGALKLSGSVAANTSTPIVTPGGAVNAASYSLVLAPGAFISIYGANFGAGATASAAPFPDSLASTQVFVGGQPLPLYFTSSGQIDAIVPYGVAPGSTQQLVVQSGNALSQPVTVTVAAAEPGVFTQNQSGSGPGAVLVVKSSGAETLNTAATPASAGDALVVFCTGLGAVSPPVAAGSAAPTSTLSYTAANVTATVGGQNAQVLFAGLAPGFVGLYQVNLVVPQGVAAGASVPLVISAGGAAGATVTVAIQ